MVDATSLFLGFHIESKPSQEVHNNLLLSTNGLWRLSLDQETDTTSLRAVCLVE